MSDVLPLVLLLLAVGAFAGIIAGLLGVGGGLILVPAFYFVFDHQGYGGPWLMQICLATSLATIIVTSARSVQSHSRNGAVHWSILRSLAIPIALGALMGVWAAANLRSTTLQMIFGVIGVMASLYMAFSRPEWRLGAAMPTGAPLAGTGLGVGFLSVLMGIGGGTFGVPLMTLFAVPIHRAVATAAGFGFLIALPSALAFLLVPVPPEAQPPYTLGAVNLPAFGLVIAMTLVTAPLGARMAHSMNPKPLKRIFAVFIGIVALNMLRKATGY